MNKKKLLALLCYLPLFANAQIISTVAGSGTSSFSGDGGPATAAALNYPCRLILDNSGSMYISDNGNNRVRKVNASGIINTIAGTGCPTLGYGDGGPATAACVYFPQGLSMDSLGNLFFAEKGHSLARKLNASGIITTIAGNVTGYSGDGGPATAALLHYPAHALVDGNGNVFIADTWNYRVRKIDTAGIITTVVGNGSPGFSGDGGPATAAKLNIPTGLAFDQAGNLLIADDANHRVRKVDPSGIITTIAGSSSTPGFSGDGGPATAARLNQPGAIVLDGAGNIYIADQINNRVRVINTLGIINTIAGTGVAAYGGDGGPASAAMLNTPTDVALDNMGNLFIADVGNNRIRKMNCVTTPYLAVLSGVDTVCVGASITLSGSITGGTWTASNGNASVSSGTVTGIFPGVDTITYSISAPCGAATRSKVVRVLPCSTLGIDAHSSTAALLYPNPAAGTVNVKSSFLLFSAAVSDITGRLLFEVPCSGYSAELNLEKLTRGVYIVKLNKEKVYRLLKE